jgi:hypothetical protein
MRGGHVVEESEPAGGLVPATGAHKWLADWQLGSAAFQVMIINMAQEAPILTAEK